MISGTVISRLIAGYHKLSFLEHFHSHLVFRVTTLGTLSIADPRGAPVELTSRRRALVLVALAAASGEHGISRDRALALLWPEHDERTARNNLKQTVFAVRRVLGAET